VAGIRKETLWNPEEKYHQADRTMTAKCLLQNILDIEILMSFDPV